MGRVDRWHLVHLLAFIGVQGEPGWHRLEKVLKKWAYVPLRHGIRLQRNGPLSLHATVSLYFMMYNEPNASHVCHAMIHVPKSCFVRSISRRIDSLRYSRPFRQFCIIISIVLCPQASSYRNSLRMLFLYFFSFLSKIVYLSFGTISCSTGISSFHLSTAFVVIPCLAKA